MSHRGTTDTWFHTAPSPFIWSTSCGRSFGGVGRPGAGPSRCTKWSEDVLAGPCRSRARAPRGRCRPRRISADLQRAPSTRRPAGTSRRATRRAAVDLTARGTSAFSKCQRLVPYIWRRRRAAGRPAVRARRTDRAPLPLLLVYLRRAPAPSTPPCRASGCARPSRADQIFGVVRRKPPSCCFPDQEAHAWLVEVRVVPHAEEVLVHVALPTSSPRERGAARGLEVTGGPRRCGLCLRRSG